MHLQQRMQKHLLNSGKVGDDGDYPRLLTQGDHLAPSSWGIAVYRFGRSRRAAEVRPDSGEESPNPLAATTVRITCAIDSRTHEVGEQEFTTADSGRYRALCGAIVAAAPMAAPEGQRCERCLTARQPRARRTQLVRRLA